MNMILMHKNEPVANFVNGVRLSTVYQPEELPLGLSMSPLLERQFQAWFSHRTIPNNRVFIEKIRSKLGYDMTEAMIRNLSLSLTDTYWLKPEYSELKWEDVNFHDNLFSNDIGIAFLNDTGFLQDLHPNFTTDGVLDKTWVILENKPYLIKLGTKYERQILGEIFSSRVGKYLGLDIVEYRPLLISGTPSCICPCIVQDSMTDMVYAMQYKQAYKATGIELFQILSEINDNKIQAMLAFDTLLHQEDRHEYNISILNHDNLAPMYDSGRCLSLERDCKPFVRDRLKQASLITTIPFDLPSEFLLQQFYEESCEDLKLPKSEAELQALHQGYIELQTTYERLDKLHEDRSDLERES